MTITLTPPNAPPTFLSETYDFLWVPVQIYDPAEQTYEIVTSGVQYSVVLVPTGGVAPRPGTGDAPGAWAPAVIYNTMTGIDIQDYSRGTWLVYAKITDAPYLPVIMCGTFTVN